MSVSRSLYILQRKSDSCHNVVFKTSNITFYSGKKSQSNFIQNAIRSGTVVDKVMALTQAVMEFPQHNVAYFETLVNMAKKKCRREAILAAGVCLPIVLQEYSVNIFLSNICFE